MTSVERDPKAGGLTAACCRKENSNRKFKLFVETIHHPLHDRDGKYTLVCSFRSPLASIKAEAILPRAMFLFISANYSYNHATIIS